MGRTGSGKTTLARVFLCDPDLVILDEACSRLDPATERCIEWAIDKLLYAPRCTAIVIAHRLSTVQRADRVLVLAGGQIVECCCGRRRL